MNPKKINGKWGYNFMYKGKRYRQQGLASKKEAQAIIDQIIHDVAHGVDVNSNVLFAEYFERWIKVNKESSLKDKSYQRVVSTLNKVRDYFPENTRLKDLDQLNYQEFINHYAEDLTKETVNKIHYPIKACLDDAVYAGLIKRNPTYKAHIYGKKKSKDEKFKFMNLNQYIDMKEFLKGKSSRSALLLYILHVTGCRFGEANTLSLLSFNKEKGTIFINGTKTSSSIRTVRIPESDMIYIMNRIEQLGIGNNNKLFGLSHKSCEKTFKDGAAKLGIPDEVTIHSLRHTHCSFLYNNDVSIYYISKRLGHKDIKITLEVYSHLFEETFEKDDEKTVDIIEKMSQLKVAS